MKRIREKLTYANVMATIAVFLVLGGGAAVAAGGLAKNSVGPNQLKKNAVTTAKIKKGAVTGAKIKASSLPTVPTANNSNLLGGVPAGGFQQKPLWALVNGTGAILAQSGGISLQDKTATGGFYLHFPQPLAGKAISATPWAGWEGTDPAVEAGVCGNNAAPDTIGCNKGTNTTSDLFVGTQESGTFKPVAFYVIVFP
jgi:hypothetical protein